MKISDNITVDFHHSVEKKESACVLTAYGEEFSTKAVCSKDDQFDRRTGRRISLQRVLKKSSLSREGRTKVWQVLRDKKVKLVF